MTSNLISCYVAVWNEPDAAVRRSTVAQLRAEDGVQYTETAEHRGRDAVEARITGAHEQFVATRAFVFTAADDAVTHHDAVTFTTHLVPAAGGAPVWSGTVFVLLDRDGRIRRDYQFTGAAASTRAVVTEFLGRLAEGEPDRIAALFADVVDWQLDWPETGHPAVPWIRPRSTRAEVADHFRELGAAHGERDGVAPRILIDGRDAVVLGDIRQTVKVTGRAYAARCTSPSTMA